MTDTAQIHDEIHRCRNIKSASGHSSFGETCASYLFSLISARYFYMIQIIENNDIREDSPGVLKVLIGI
jgi:hypothetical protein